jgi:hypothetical protein
VRVTIEWDAGLGEDLEPMYDDRMRRWVQGRLEARAARVARSLDRSAAERPGVAAEVAS